jgi:hypothetical protein
VVLSLHIDMLGNEAIDAAAKKSDLHGNLTSN